MAEDKVEAMNLRFSAGEFHKLAKIAEALDGPLSMSLALQIIRELRVPPDETPPVPKSLTANQKSAGALAEILKRPLSELDFNVRARRIYQTLNCVTIGDLIQRSEADLRATRGSRITTIEEIKARLAQLGLTLGITAPD